MSEKYPRTPHLPWSPGMTSRERVLADVTTLLRRDLILTEKMDGSNVCLEREHVYARSHADAPRHESFNALKTLHANLRRQIPESQQWFGEWLWARHSIGYARLPAYLLMFGIHDEARQEWLAWDACTFLWQSVGLHTVPVLWRGVADTEEVLWQRTEQSTADCAIGSAQEGIVVRVADAFPNGDFANCVAKCVRAGHVQTEQHWSQQAIVRNQVAEMWKRDGS